ncbi:GNAT family N-acetyltransferase [Actinotalea fermentans]|uniref:N-acetyltransferase n=1 Tax=Actinotalea fermentans TaxID=43671 RepID=A0A511YX35_9CELL|nr:GNAT family N-acetyltransferase [Actinotalea fermentans]KGM15633.1 acetyltransferase [Actinotalea fermentans ATCC 43279 = JCM 9966 = DSM 3133]GEN79765.1 N-acetyltransferase [Actinotalea fermentans]
MSDVIVRDHPERSRWEARLGGPDARVAGYAAYRREDGRITFTHTVVEPEHEGAGIGSALARAALDDARTAGLRVVPQCPFIAAWIRRHPDYADLVDAPSPA